MERFSRTDRACVLAAAAAHDFNNELTVILSSASMLIGELSPGHPARRQALELQEAVRRCARKTSGLLQFGMRRGGHTVRTPLESLLNEA